jgi:Kef-type K+ transport system membrane component KefB
MFMIAQRAHLHDVGLPEPIVRKRRRSRRMATIMLAVALATAIAGWVLFGTSIVNAIHIKEEAPSRAIIAYVLLIISSATLVLGFWYLLLAQVQRLARMVDAQELEELSATGETCASCHRRSAEGDRFCRYCGAALPAEGEAT